jgi:hypothetical protein
MGDAKPYASKEEEEEARLGGARRNLEQWAERNGGFSGSVRMQAQTVGSDGRSVVSRVHEVPIGEQPKPAGMTRLPRGTSFEQVSEIFKERDRVKAAAAENEAVADPAALTVAAIDNVKRGHVTPIRVLKYSWLRWFYNAITREVS